MRRLQETAAVKMELISHDAPLEAALEDGFRLEGAAWKAGEGTSIASDTAVKNFYATLARRFAKEGWLKLHFLRAGEDRIAFQYAVTYKDRVFSLKPGFDPAYAQYSPSNLLFLLFLEHLFQSGVSEYDLLGVQEEWKMQWAQHIRAHYWLFIFSNTLIPSLIHWVKFQCLPALRRQRSAGRLQHVIAAAGVNL